MRHVAKQPKQRGPIKKKRHRGLKNAGPIHVNLCDKLPPRTDALDIHMAESGGGVRKRGERGGGAPVAETWLKQWPIAADEAVQAMASRRGRRSLACNSPGDQACPFPTVVGAATCLSGVAPKT